MDKFRNILWGIVLISIGLILAGNVLGITDIDIFFDGWWTLFIIIPCFIGLFREDGKTGYLIGLLIGIVLLLCCRGILNFIVIWELILPVILIIIGVTIIFKDSIGGKVNSEIKKLNEQRQNQNEYCATFSEQNVNFAGVDFKGTGLIAVFGSVKCDLRNAVIKEDVVINATSVFGGIEISVPSNVQIKIKSVPIFGGVSNKANTKANENSPTIYINSTAVFGGVEIK